MLNSLTQQLRRAEPLSRDQVKCAVGQLIDGTITVETKANFLTALAAKGETIEEIAGFAAELRDKSIAPPLDDATRAAEMIDVCGTGGDHLRTFNISTTVAIVVASAGVMVAKHGNRAITSQSGSADVLEALGVPVDLAPQQAADSLREHQFAFFFAPRFHPAFKHIGPVRKLCAERGQRTIFNLLGPLLNPARPTTQLIGVPRPELCEPIGRVLQVLGARRGMVVCGCIGEPSASTARCHLDEISTLGDTQIAEFYQERAFSVSRLPISGFPVQNARLADLEGGDAQANAGIIRRILNREDVGPKREAVLLNCAGALLVAGKVRSLSEGWDFAAMLIDSGRAFEKLKRLSR